MGSLLTEMQNAKPLLQLDRTTFSATLKIYVWFGWVKNNFEVFKFMVVANFDKQMTSLRLFQWFSISRAPLRVHVSQADGLLLRWMYTHWGPHYGSGKRAIATATSSSILTRWSMATIRGGGGGWCVTTKPRDRQGCYISEILNVSAFNWCLKLCCDVIVFKDISTNVFRKS